MQHLSFVFNIILVFLFVKLCSKNESEFFFNPFVGLVSTRINKLLDFLKPVLAMPEQMAILVIATFLFLFKTLLFSRLSPVISISFGELITCTPMAEMSVPGTPARVALLVFSLLNTSTFIFKFWSFYFLTSLIAVPLRKTRASEAFSYYAMPFSRLPLLFQPVALLLLHTALAYICSSVGHLTYLQLGADRPGVIALTTAPFAIRIVKTIWLGMLSFSDAIMIMVQVLFVSIIGSMIATVLRKKELMTLCSETTELILGRFSRGGASRGGLDFTPIIFFFVAHYGYMIICTFVTNLINTPIQLPF
ncbi:MAG: hypothetical protein PHO37_10605 [Kiritimatiellae bacterium]|nr:hypothetical protein [Kiritimatiellia bacterium]